MGISGLGAGLDTLFSDNSSEVQIKQTLRTSEIEPNRNQPRKNFNSENISALAESIREHGMLQPILVRPIKMGGYQIVAGERRWRAAKMLGLEEVPVSILELSDTEVMQIAVIENLQREDLNPIEEALAYKDLTDNYGMTQEQISKLTGRSRPAISNSMRMLELPEIVRELVGKGSLSTGHAKVLLGVKDSAELESLAIKASDGGMTVRQLEKAVKEPEQKKSEKKVSSRRDSYFTEMEISLNENLGRRVKIDYKKNKGVLMLEFYNREDLAWLADRLAKDEQE